MLRKTLADMARVGNTMFRRATLRKADDTKLMQSVDLDGVMNERKLKVERFQNYGFTSVPHPQKDDKTNEVAEVILLYVGGSGGHPIAFAIDDRRHRLKNMKPGESAMYDDQRQIIRITRDGIVISVPDSKTISHKVHSEEKRGEKDYGQDASKEPATKTKITQGKDFFEFTVGDKTKVRFDEQKGITFTTDKDITSNADGTIVANGDTHNWKGPKET